MTNVASTPGGPITPPGSDRARSPGPDRVRADDGRRARIVSSAGTVLAVAVDRWFNEPSPAEHALLELAVGPVLDIGCGPGRHVLALSAAGVPALGIDISTAFLAVARRDGASVVRCSVFDDVPRAGRWRTALLLDGNIGIGADPDALLRRVRQLLVAGGHVLVEAEPPGSSARCDDVHVQLDSNLGPRFSWARVSIDRVRESAATVGMSVTRCWSAEGRWFAELAGG
jgi:SAM-dependent methyltransferase